MLMIQVYMVTIMRECTVFVVRRRDVIRELLWYFDGTSLVLRIYYGFTILLPWYYVRAIMLLSCTLLYYDYTTIALRCTLLEPCSTHALHVM